MSIIISETAFLSTKIHFPLNFFLNLIRHVHYIIYKNNNYLYL